MRAGLACILIGLAACGGKTETHARGATPVRVRAVAEAAGATVSRYSGTIEPGARVDMAFRVGGYVESIGDVVEGAVRRPLEKGDAVKKGTVLARVRSGDHLQRLATANAAVSEARSRLRLAEIERDRTNALVGDNAVPKAELDVRAAQAESARAALAGATAQAREASMMLGDTTLVAPMDGVVLARHVEVGSLVGPGTPAFVIVDTRQVKAVFGAPQSLVEKLRVGGPLDVLVPSEDSGSGEEALRVKVTRIAPAAEASGRVFSIEAALPNPTGRLRPGQVVSVIIPGVAPAAGGTVVPLSAVVRSPRDARGFAVFVIEGDGDRGTARLKDVKLGEVLGNDVAVVAGLTNGNRVVTMGATILRDGDPAVVIPGT